MPQTGPDLVGAGYPISRPILALLGANANVSQPNVPIATNLDFGLGGLQDVSYTGASIYFVPVPVSPGYTVSKISVAVGATYASATSSWAGLYTGTGSAPGTTGAQPALIGVTGSTGTWTSAQSLTTWSFATPVTISQVQAPYGYVYAAIELGANNTVSLLSMTCASVAMYPWYPATSPFSLNMTNASTQASAAPTSIGTATRVVNPPVVLLS